MSTWLIVNRFPALPADYGLIASKVGNSVLQIKYVDMLHFSLYKHIVQMRVY
jgi:hypothetical protein